MPRMFWFGTGHRRWFWRGVCRARRGIWALLGDSVLITDGLERRRECREVDGERGRLYGSVFGGVVMLDL